MKRPIKVLSAKFVEEPEFIKGKKKKHDAAQKRGLAYERRVGKELVKIWGDRVRLGAWVQYDRVSGKPGKFCQPDAVLTLDDRIVCIEVKLSHRPDAEDKLRNLYAQVLGAIYPGKEITLVQVTRNLRLGDKATARLSELHELSSPYSLIHWIP